MESEPTENTETTVEQKSSVTANDEVEATKIVTEQVKEELKIEPAATVEKTNGKKASASKDKDKGKDRTQSERERNRRGERSSRSRAVSKGSVYKPRSRHRVHISNIPYEYRWQDLKDLFRTEVGEVSFVELFEDEHGKPRGCGIVEFEKVEHVRAALDKMNRFELKGRRLVVKEDSDVEVHDGSGRSAKGDRQSIRDDSGRGARGSGGAGTLASPSSTRWSNTYGLSPEFLDSLGVSGPLFNRVFVANLDYKVEDSKLREVFQLAGKVVFAEVVKDRDGRSRGFGVVEMNHPVEAVQAISMFNNQMLFDRRMTVRMDREGERNEPRSSSRLPEGLRSIGQGLGARGNPIQDVPFVAPQLPSSERSGYRESMYRSGYSPERDSYQRGRYSSSSGMMSTSMERPRDIGSGSSSLMSNVSVTDYARNRASEGSSYSSYSSGGGSSAMYSGTLPSNATYGSNTTYGGSNGTYGSNTTYGYSTESMGTRNSSLTSYSDYEGRSDYDGYRTQQQNPREMTDYRATPSAYSDIMNRMPYSATTITPSMGLSSRTSDTVVVTNLPATCSWQDLRDKFCEVGDVLFADIRAKGSGVVRFSSERDAQRACSLLNRTRMDGNIIEVEFY